jgi:hypothetical protein
MSYFLILDPRSVFLFRRPLQVVQDLDVSGTCLAWWSAFVLFQANRPFWSMVTGYWEGRNHYGVTAFCLRKI